MLEYELVGHEFIPLCHLLKTMGFCPTSGQAKLVIADGLVRVDGTVEARKQCKIRDGQMVEFEGQMIKVISKK